MVIRHHNQWAGVAGLVFAGIAALGFVAYLTSPAAAQFFDERFPFFGRAPPLLAPPKPTDFSHAPPPRKADKAEKAEGADLNVVVVMGDSMADWLAYGLEIAEADTPEIAILRKHRSGSSLIFTQGRHDPRGRFVDWPALARETLAKEQAQIVVMMIGLGDRDPIRERQAPVATKGTAADAAKSGAPDAAKGGPEDAATKGAKPDEAAKSAPPDAAADGEQHSPSESAPADDQAAADQPSIMSPELRGAITNTYEFKSEKWTELYNKRIDETIAALKSKGVPVFWVGLPPIRGPKSMADIAFLNDLYRARAEKAGITYVDVWDGFVDEAGRFNTQGPDFEGQIRRLRSSDGVYFTTAGARKLAHYVDREIQRALAHVGPVAIPLPVEPLQQAPAAQPGGATPRPLAGPVIPLNASIDPSASGGDELAGSGGVRQTIADAVAARVLVRGEPMPAPAGRADDFVWPRRGLAPVGTDPVAATTTLPMTPMVAERPPAPRASTALASANGAAALKPPRTAAGLPGGALRPPGVIGQQIPPRQEARRSGPSPFFFFFFGGR